MVHTRLCTLALIVSLPLVATTAQTLGGEVTSEWQWSPTEKAVNWMNLLRLDFEWSPWKGGTIEAATIHMAKTNPAESVIADYQTFSNIQEENCYAAIATLGLWQEVGGFRAFVGTRNVNEDYFTSPVTSFFTSSSPGIFPTISATYPIANNPLASPTHHMEYENGSWRVKNSLYSGVGYNGWKRGDNPFCLRPKEDGVFNVTELSHETERHFFSLGTTVHNRQFSETADATHRVSLAWWLYAEQTVFERDDKSVQLMAQYSHNTLSLASMQEAGMGCKQYAELGCLYSFGEANAIGTSAQYALFAQGREESLEITYSRDIRQRLSVQPVFNYIHNNLGDYVVLSGRLTYSF